MESMLSYSEYVKVLEAKGYKCIYCSDNARGNGIAYHETDSSVLKIEYKWDKLVERHYVGGEILSIEDVTACYR